MSCTVIAVPYALAWIFGTIAAAAVTTNAAESAMESYFDAKTTDDYKNTFKYDEHCEDVHKITTEHFIEKDFETPFVDKEILIKTLEEHGVTNITDNNNQIFGVVEGYNLTFSRSEENQPYSVRISSKEQDSADEKLNDLNSEYAMNVQEDAYLHIIEKLKENNMQIEEEVVEDDNTIVLTININD